MNKNITDYTEEEIKKLINDAVYTNYGLPIITLDNGEEWQIAADFEEINSACREYFEEEAYEFDPDFLAEVTGISSNVFSLLEKEMEGQSNVAINKIVEGTCGVDTLVEKFMKQDDCYYFLDSEHGKLVNLPCGFMAFQYN